MNYLFSPLNWSQFFPKHVLPTHSFPLTPQLIKFFLQDQPILPSAYFDLNSSHYFPYNDSTTNGYLLKQPIHCNQQHVDVLELILHLQRLLNAFQTGIFPKVDHISPNDATWLLPDHTIKCYTPKEIFLLLTGSTKITEYLHHYCHTSGLSLTDIHTPALITPIPLNTTSLPPPPHHTYQNQYETSCNPQLHLQPSLITRKWYNTIHPSESYRITVQNGYILSISQRDGIMYDDYIKEPELLSKVYSLLHIFHSAKFIPQWTKYIDFVNGKNEHINCDQFDLYALNNINVVYDVYISTKTRAIRVLDVYPFIITDNDGLIESSPQFTLNNAMNSKISTNSINIYNKHLNNILFLNKEIKLYTNLQQLLSLSFSFLALSPYIQSQQQLRSENLLSFISALPNKQEKRLFTLHNQNAKKNALSALSPVLLSFLTKFKYNTIELLLHILNLLNHIKIIKDQCSNDSTAIHINHTKHPLFYYITPVLPSIPETVCLDLILTTLPAPLSTHFISKSILLPTAPETSSSEVITEEIMSTATLSVSAHSSPINPSKQDETRSNDTIISSIPPQFAAMFYHMVYNLPQDFFNVLNYIKAHDPPIRQKTLINNDYYTYHNPASFTSIQQLLPHDMDKLTTFFLNFIENGPNEHVYYLSLLLYFLFYSWSYQEALHPGAYDYNDQGCDINGNSFPKLDVMDQQVDLGSINATSTYDSFITNEMLSFNTKLQTAVVELYRSGLLFIKENDNLADLSLHHDYYQQFFTKVHESGNVIRTKLKFTKEQDKTEQKKKHQRVVLFIEYPHQILPKWEGPDEILEESTVSDLLSVIADQKSSLPFFFPHLAQSAKVDSHFALAHSTPLRVVMDYTKQREEERITVSQEMQRLPEVGEDHAAFNIDVSSAEGIEQFVALMKMMEGHYSDDDDDEDDEDNEDDHEVDDDVN